MKIGILIKNFENLSNWELRIIEAINNNPALELAVLIFDGRVGEENQGTFKNKMKRLFSSSNVLGQLMFKLQALIERKIFFKEKFTVDRNLIIEQLKTIAALNVHPKRKGFLDIFDQKDVDLIKKYNLDIILRHEFNIIRGKILTEASKHGIWSFHHADNSINRGGPVGFWEIVLKQPTIGVTLQKLTPELDGGLIIDKAYFNRHWSFVKSSYMVFEGSVSLLFKNIEKLQNGTYSTVKSPVYYNPLYRVPNVRYTIKYIWSFYMKVLDRLVDKVLYRIIGARATCWTLFIGKGNFMDATLFRLKPVKLPKDEFWADPFLFSHENEEYIFFENYSYTTELGKISCGKIDNGKIIDVVDVLDFGYHLSYPYIFKEDGEIYMMPETHENKRLEIYRCTNFPKEWELHVTAFEGEMVADAHFYTDTQNQKWLFLNKKVDDSVLPDNELYLYKVDSIQLENLQSHAQNPVLIDSRTARNGGTIFEYNGEIYRPSQRNVDGIYGRCLNINRIEKLDINEYVETHVVTVEPNFHKGLISVHHLHQTEKRFVIDAAYKRK